MATLAYALTSTAKVKDRLAVTVADATRDAVFLSMIYAATDFIEKACGGVRFKRTTYTQELYDGSMLGDMNVKMPNLILKNAPLISISAFQYRTGSRSNPSWVDFGADDYEPMLNAGILHVAGGLPSGLQNIRISYIAGYLIDFTNEMDDSLHTLPHDISDLCERLVTKLIKRRESEGRSQESFNNSSINWGSFLEDHDKTIIANYRRTFLV